MARSSCLEDWQNILLTKVKLLVYILIEIDYWEDDTEHKLKFIWRVYMLYNLWKVLWIPSFDKLLFAVRSALYLFKNITQEAKKEKLLCSINYSYFKKLLVPVLD